MLQDMLHVFCCPFFRTLIYLGEQKKKTKQNQKTHRNKVQIRLFIPLLFLKIVVIEWLPLWAAVFTSKRTDWLG